MHFFNLVNKVLFKCAFLRFNDEEGFYIKKGTVPIILFLELFLYIGSAGKYLFRLLQVL